MARLLLLLALLSCVFCEDVPEPPSLDDLRKLRIPELKKFLMARGKTCDGCAEKADFVELAFAVRDLPTATPVPTPPPPPEKMSPEVEEMIRKMRFGGRGGGGKIEKIKKRLEKRGYDMSGVNTMSISGFENLDEAMIENLLIAMSKGKGRPFTQEERAAPPPKAGDDLPEPDLSGVEEVEVTDDVEEL